MSANPGNQGRPLTPPEKELVVNKKATCPFIGSAVAQGRLPVLGTADNPLAGIDVVKALGNSGGGNLGLVLALFANGNHAKMKDASGKLAAAVPAGLFSLEFPGSQGSHAGHSGILQGDPRRLDSGRLSQADFKRLTDRQADGVIKRSDVGRFIAENLRKDPDSKVRVEIADAALTARDLAELVTLLLSKGPSDRDVKTKFTKMAGANNLIGSAGEFGLLFAFLANGPNTKEIDGEPALAVADLEAMFVAKRLPERWDTWEKSATDWVTNTSALFLSAAREFHALGRK